VPPHDPDRTRTRILDAAMRAFAKAGLAGARVDAIARRARANKRMIYHYFGSKRGLFEAVVARSTERNAALLADMPDTPARILLDWDRGVALNLPWIRLLSWEALERGAGPITGAAVRRENMRKARDRLREAGARGLVAPDLDAPQLLLALTAIAVFPWAFPQVTELITGRPPSAPRFRAERARFLERLGDLLSPAAAKRKARPRT